jgi:hypothetical protein
MEPFLFHITELFKCTLITRGGWSPTAISSFRLEVDPFDFYRTTRPLILMAFVYSTARRDSDESEKISTVLWARLKSKVLQNGSGLY